MCSCWKAFVFCLRLLRFQPIFWLPSEFSGVHLIFLNKKLPRDTVQKKKKLAWEAKIPCQHLTVPAGLIIPTTGGTNDVEIYLCSKYCGLCRLKRTMEIQTVRRRLWMRFACDLSRRSKLHGVSCQDVWSKTGWCVKGETWVSKHRGYVVSKRWIHLDGTLVLKALDILMEAETQAIWEAIRIYRGMFDCKCLEKSPPASTQFRGFTCLLHEILILKSEDLQIRHPPWICEILSFVDLHGDLWVEANVA